MRIASRDIRPHTLLPRKMAVILCPSPLQGTEHGQCFFLQWPRSFSPLLPSKVAVKSRLLGCRDKARPLLPPLTVRAPPLLSLSKTAVAVDSCVLQKRIAIIVTFLSGRSPSPFGNSVKQELPHAIFLCRRWSIATFCFPWQPRSPQPAITKTSNSGLLSFSVGGWNVAIVAFLCR